MVAVLLLVKDYEIVLSLSWSWTRGKGYAEAMREALRGWARDPDSFEPDDMVNILSDHERMWATSDWPAKRWFASNMGRWGGLWLDHVFRWPELMTGLSLAVFLLRPGPVAVACVAILTGNLLLQTAHYLVNRVRLGAMDSYFRRSADYRVADPSPPQAQEAVMTPQDLASDFVHMIGPFLLVFIFSFGAIYYGAANAVGFDQAFPELGHSSGGWKPALDMMYFSILTTATVGYGDYDLSSYPVKFLVALHHLCGFAIVILVVTSFTLTSEATSAGLCSAGDRSKRGTGRVNNL
jgi:hypothetical protein